MGKTKPRQKATDLIAKQSLHDIKNGSVKKNKNPNFKNTSVPKAALIDNAKTQNKNASPQKNINLKNNQSSPKTKIQQSKNMQEISKKKQNSRDVPQKNVNKKISKAQKNLGKKGLINNSGDSCFDIDEGIIPQEDTSMGCLDETFEDEDFHSDPEIPNIFGTSLAEESDSDDEDFEGEEKEEEEDEEDEEMDEEEEDDSDSSEEEKIIEYKGIKMFKGIKPKTNNENSKVDKDNDEEEDLYESDEKILNKADTLVSGMEDDEDDNEEEEEDVDLEDENDEDIEDKNDEDIEDENDKDTEEENDEDTEDESGEDVKNEYDKDEDEEDDDKDEDEIGDEAASLGIEALLGKTITDDDDDEDFDEDFDEDDEDDDISDEDEDNEVNDDIAQVAKRLKVKVSDSKTSPIKEKQTERIPSAEEQKEIDKRTICIDNIPIETKQETIKKIFGQYGPISNIHVRGIIPQHPKMAKRVAAITGQIHPKLTTVIAFVKYKSHESAKKALSMNAKLFEGNYVNVKIVAKSFEKEHDSKKAVFIGNLKFGTEKNTIWKCFSKCGEIESIHLMRDGATGATKGFGYVNFKSKDSVALALKLDGVEICDRPMRVSLCLNKKIDKKGRKRQSSSENITNKPMKKYKNNSQKSVAHPAQHETSIKKQQKSPKSNKKIKNKNSAAFQGQMTDMKEKKKKSKSDKKKKMMAEKLKPKKMARA